MSGAGAGAGAVGAEEEQQKGSTSEGNAATTGMATTLGDATVGDDEYGPSRLPVVKGTVQADSIVVAMAQGRDKVRTKGMPRWAGEALAGSVSQPATTWIHYSFHSLID